MDPRRLLIFREVAKRGSLSAAAAALGWTQPAVGQHIHRLERDLGLPLALRSTRGITLTDAGTALLVHADAVAARLSAAEEDMLSLSTLRSGRLRLAAFPSACALLIPQALVSLARQAPDLDVRLTELEPPEARALVLAGDADLAVTFDYAFRTPIIAAPGPARPLETDSENDPDQHRDLVAVPLLDDPVRAVLATTNPLARPDNAETTIQLSELATQPWIAGCKRCRSHLVAAAAAAGFMPDVRHSTDDYVVVQNLVAAGLGVALLPQLALTAAPNAGVRAVAVAGNPIRQIRLIARKEMADTPAVQAGVRVLRSSAAAMLRGRVTGQADQPAL